MKKLLSIIFFSFFIFGCAKDGQDGKAYLSFTWDWYVDAYTDNNPGVPNTINEYSNYEVRAGTYYYEYLCSDGDGYYWGYEGRYTISINEGNPAELFKDGEDGEDNYFRMALTGSGTRFYLMKEGGKEKLKFINKSNFDISQYKKIYVGEVEKDIHYSNNGTFTITRQKFILEKID